MGLHSHRQGEANIFVLFKSEANLQSLKQHQLGSQILTNRKKYLTVPREAVLFQYFYIY